MTRLYENVYPPLWPRTWYGSAVRGGTDSGVHLGQRFFARVSPRSNKPSIPSGVEELVSDLSGGDNTLICLSAGYRMTLHRSNTQSSCLHESHRTGMWAHPKRHWLTLSPLLCPLWATKRLWNAVLWFFYVATESMLKEERNYRPELDLTHRRGALLLVNLITRLSRSGRTSRSLKNMLYTLLRCLLLVHCCAITLKNVTPHFQKSHIYATGEIETGFKSNAKVRIVNAGAYFCFLCFDIGTHRSALLSYEAVSARYSATELRTFFRDLIFLWYLVKWVP